MNLMKMEFWLTSFLLSHFEDFQSNSYIPMFVALIFAIFNQKITFRIMFSSQIFTEKVKTWSTKFCFYQIHPLVGFWPFLKWGSPYYPADNRFPNSWHNPPPLPPIRDRVNISFLIYSFSYSEYKMIYMTMVPWKKKLRKKPLLLYCS